jgi:acyl-CoA thioesterase-1
VVEVYGDSIASGQLATAAGEPQRHLEVRPAQRLQQILAGRAVVLDRAQAGATVAGALVGFAAQLAADRPGVVVLRFGGADVVLGTPVRVFAESLGAMVDTARAAGARVLLVGLVHHPEHDLRGALFDAAIQTVAGWKGAAFADTFALPAGPLADGVHPDQRYSDAMTALIAAALPLPN